MSFCTDRLFFCSGLNDGKHCTLPHLTGKTFVFNEAEQRLELCVDAAGHFPVSPDVEELVREAVVQLRTEPAATRGSRESSPGQSALRLGSGGVVRKKEPLQNVAAFQGKGHSLGSGVGSSPSPEHRPITRQHSGGVDLSSSVSDVSADAGGELVRVAPGFVTMKDGRGLDPSLMEQQRRKLQEMVSSIQASMECHLREQQSATASVAAGDGAVKERAQEDRSADGLPCGDLEESDDMESQETGQGGATEPMDHS